MMENKEYNNNEISDLFNEEDFKNKRKEEVDLFDLLEQNMELSKEILEISRYIKKYVVFQRIMTFVKIFIILIPILLAFIYLPPLLQGLVEPFQSVIGIYTGVESGNFDVLQNLNK